MILYTLTSVSPTCLLNCTPYCRSFMASTMSGLKVMRRRSGAYSCSNRWVHRLSGCWWRPTICNPQLLACHSRLPNQQEYHTAIEGAVLILTVPSAVGGTAALQRLLMETAIRIATCIIVCQAAMPLLPHSLG